MPKLFLDFETASELDLNAVGVDNYAKHPSTRVLLAGYAIDNGPIHIWEGKGKFPTEDTFGTWFDSDIVSWNSTFERYILKYVLKINLPLEKFTDPMIQARHLSMPGKLERVCQILQLPEGKLDGDKLKNLFCYPAHPGGVETLFGLSEPRFNDYDSHPTEWKEFIEYCRRDVEVLRKIYTIFLSHPLPPGEREGWLLDQKINDQGMPVDLELVQKMDKIAERAKNEAFGKIKVISGVENPNSGPQLLKWLSTQGYRQSNLQKPTVNRALEDIGLSNEAAEVLELRKESSKTSDAKLQALKLAVSPDGFVRDQFSYMGAARTGRWAGHGVQLHNLPRPTKEVEKNFDRAVELLLAGDYDGIVREFPSVMGVVAGCIRPCFLAPVGKKFVIADLSAIEHVVVGYLSGCEAILDVHRQGKDPYLDFAETLFKIPYKDMIYIDKNGVHKCKEEYKDLRQLAKPPVLGCGFQLSGGEEVINEDGEKVKTGLAGYAKNVCNVDMDIELSNKAVRLYRQKNKEVTDFWPNLEDAAIQVIRSKRKITLRKLVLDMHGQTFRIQLPSGRYLHYIRPRVVQREFRGNAKDTIVFEGLENKVWGEQTTYGGKLTENCVQAVARDILLEGMKLADKRGLAICGHFHDEIAALVEDSDEKALDILRSSMRQYPAWAKELTFLRAEGFETQRYRKG
jgi:DNA polymerase bacteriophage-type